MIKIAEKTFALLIFLIFFYVCCSIMVNAQNPPQNSADWSTPAEQTDYKTTPRYAATLEYLTRLDNASPNIKLTTFGKTGEGRDLPLVIAAKADAVTPDKARKQGKIVILIQACIHAGESDGKDAGLALLRDLAFNKTLQNFLDKMTILFVPIYNADGHERFGAYNRINQNGPAEMGFRANATNLNLNRDYMKADAPETQSWLALWNAWQPDFFIDNHVTDGADYQYNLTYQFEHHETIAPSIKNWLENSIEKRAVATAEAAGNLLAPYLEFRDNRDLKLGINEFLSTPRFATGYPVLRNRPAVLIETHMLKSYKIRVKANYDFLRAMLEEVNRDPAARSSPQNKAADAKTLADFQNYNAAKLYPLSLDVTNQSTPFKLKAIEPRTELSEISGALRVSFDGGQPVELTVPYYNQTQVATSVAPPLAYIIPPQWTEVVQKLELHNLKIERLSAPQTLMVETYRLTGTKWAAAPFENRVMLRDFKSKKIPSGANIQLVRSLSDCNNRRRRWRFICLNRLRRILSFVGGFFNSIFEQKEYGEGYVLEKLAREMFAKDAGLQREFEEKLRTDAGFGRQSFRKTQFLFERSPYADKNIGLYPVARVLQSVAASQNSGNTKFVNKKSKKQKK